MRSELIISSATGINMASHHHCTLQGHPKHYEIEESIRAQLTHFRVSLTAPSSRLGRRLVSSQSRLDLLEQRTRFAHLLRTRAVEQPRAVAGRRGEEFNTTSTEGKEEMEKGGEHLGLA